MSTRRIAVARDRSVLHGLLVAALAAFTFTSGAHAQTPSAAEDAAWLGVVTGENVYVRSGPGDSYYPFARVRRGDVVRVVGKKYTWARITTEGPAFRDAFGYIRTQKSGRTRLDIAGDQATVIRRAEILAPNLNTDFNPADSWKAILRLEAGEKIRILEAIEGERAIVHKVPLPKTAEGFISANFLEPASAERIAAWKAANAPATTPAPRAKPAPAQPKPIDTTPAAPVNPPPAVVPTPTTPTATADPVRPRPEVEIPGTEGRIDDAAAPPTTPTPAPPGVTGTTTVTENAAEAAPPTETPKADPPRSPRPRRLVPEVDRPGSGPPVDRKSRDSEGRLRPRAATAPVRGDLPLINTDLEAGGHSAPYDPDAVLTPHQKYDALESAFQRLRADSIETAEVLPLRDLYRQLATEVDAKSSVAVYSRARAEQLTLWSDLQKRRVRLRDLQNQVVTNSSNASSTADAVARGDTVYTVRGQLTTSSIFDGTRLPALLRVFDERTGLTLGYVKPGDIEKAEQYVDQTVGIIAQVRLDPTYKIKLLRPSRIDLLSTKANAG